MGDSYREILIKKEQTSADKMKKAGLILLVAILAAGGLLISPIILLAAIVIGVITYLVLLPKLDVEYEYLYVNGDIDIDAIYSKQKRKRVASYNSEELELVAHTGSHALDSFVNGKGTKIVDFSSGRADAKTYTFVYNKDKGREIVKLEVDEEIIRDFRRIAPRKVNLM